LMRMPYKASQHSYGIFFGCQGLPDAGCALQSGLHVHMTSVRC
jgi:hypothetical protein